MRTSLKLVAVTIAMLVALQPLAACFSQEMTASEPECCQRMMGDCGRVSMPTSHSCCTYVDASAAALTEARKAIVKIDLPAVLMPAIEPQPLAPGRFAALRTAPESPPQSPPLSVQVLRI